MKDLSAAPFDDLLEREWLVTNRLGGYASSTIPSLNTRKYHGLLVAAMTPPVRRLVLLSRVEETVHCDGWPTPLACNEYPGTIHPNGHDGLRAFSREPFPRWAYQGDGWAIEKSLRLIEGENTVVLTYTLLSGPRGAAVELELRPLLALRPMHELMYQWNGNLAAEEKPAATGAASQWRIPPTSRTPEVFFAYTGESNGGGSDGRGNDGTFDAAPAAWYFNTIYRREQDRGYAGLEDLWCPGTVKWTLEPGQSVHFICSADPINIDRALASAESMTSRSAAAVMTTQRDTDLDLLVRAAADFVLDPRGENAERGWAGVMTAFPWSAPSVRQALIALPGLLLVTGRHALARRTLLFLAGTLRDGVIPSEFPEDGSAPRFDAADTSLWFVNAAWQYLRYSGDEAAASKLLDTIDRIILACQPGGGIGVVMEEDGLLRTRGRAMSWMDAKVGEDAVTPRAGKPVEVNALWYNAVRIAAELSERVGHRRANRTHELTSLAERIAASFNACFWNSSERCCFDVVDERGNDASIRPNQLLALSLPFPVLSIDRHADVLDRVCAELLTPFGPRTLSPRENAYRGRYRGDVAEREHALHQGSVHPWLLGALVTAQLRVHGHGQAAREHARQRLAACLDWMRNDGLGQLCELFDGDAPHRPGGAIASAAGVGELLRCYVEEIVGQAPVPLPRALQTPEIPRPAAPAKVAGKR